MCSRPGGVDGGGRGVAGGGGVVSGRAVVFAHVGLERRG